MLLFRERSIRDDCCNDRKKINVVIQTRSFNILSRDRTYYIVGVCSAIRKQANAPMYAYTYTRTAGNRWNFYYRGTVACLRFFFLVSAIFYFIVNL